MAGKKGMVHRKAKQDTLREKAWKSIRIIRTFSVDMILISSSLEPTEADYENLTRWFRHLLRHGIIRKVGSPVFRRAGEHQVYALVRETTNRPLYCEICGQSLSAQICDPSLLKKETKTKKETETKKEKETEACLCPEDHAREESKKAEVNHE